MQPNTLNYTFDHDNDGGTAASSVVLTRHAEELNKSTYRYADHNNAGIQHVMQFYRTLPKRSGNFFGTEKSSVKRTKTVSVPGVDGADVSAPIISELSFSFPVGVTSGEKLSQLMEWIGYLSSSEGKAAMIQLLNVQEI